MLIKPPSPRWKPQPWPWTWSALAEPYASIARDCVFLLPMWEAGGNQQCVVTRSVLTRVAGTANGAGPFGTALNRTNGTLDHVIGPAGFRPIANPLSGYTIFGVANPEAASTSSTAGCGSMFLMRKTNPWVQYGLLYNFSAAGGDPTDPLVGASAVGQAVAYQYNDTGGFLSAVAPGVVDGRWHAWASRYNGSNETTIWRDGLIQGTQTGTPPTFSDPSQVVVIGGLNAAGYGTIGGIGLVSAWDRSLADWEMRALHDNPMGLVTRAPEKTFFIPEDLASGFTASSEATLPKFTALAAATRSAPPPPSRFYLPSSGTAPVSPAFDAAWNDTSSVVPRPTSTTKGSSAIAEVADAETSTSNTWDVCLGQFISAPLVAQTISGTVKGIIRGRESASGANARSQIVVKVVSNDGSTVRGTLLASDETVTNVNEWVISANSTGSRNAYFPNGTGPATLTSVDAQDGDRLVFEVGARAVNTSGTSFTVGLVFGEAAASDAAENATATTSTNPWIEFSKSIDFASDVSGDAVGLMPAFGSLSEGTASSRFGTSAATVPTFTTLASASRTIPDRTASVIGVTPKFTSLSDGARTIPARTATALGVVPKFAALAAATADPPARTATAVGIAPKFTGTASATRTIPDRTATAVGVTPKFSTLAAAIRTIPDRTATSATTMPKMGVLAGAARTIPSRSGDATGTMPKFSALAAATAAVPQFSINSSAVVPKFAALAAATRLPPPITAAAVGVLPKFAALVSADRQPPDLTGLSLGVLPKFGVVAAAVRTIPNRTATAIGVTPKFGSLAAATRAIPNGTATVTGVLPRFTALAAAARTIPDRTASATGLLPKFGTVASTIAGIPERTAQSTGALPKFTALAAGFAAAPGRSATSAATLPKFGSLGAGVRAIPNRTAELAGVLPKFSVLAAASRTIPARTASSAATTPKFGALASAIHLAPGSGASIAILPKFTGVAVATHAILPRTGTSSAGLIKLGGSATALVKEPVSGVVIAVMPRFGSLAAGETKAPSTGLSASRLPKFGATSAGIASQRNEFSFEFSFEFDRAGDIRTSDSASSLKPFGSRASAIRLPVPVTATASAALPLFRTLASTSALTPVFAGASVARLRGFASAAEASATVPVFDGASASTMPRFGSRATGRFISLEAADIVVREYLTARVKRTDRISVTAVRRHTVAAPVRRLAKITARTRTP